MPGSLFAEVTNRQLIARLGSLLDDRHGVKLLEEQGTLISANTVSVRGQSYALAGSAVNVPVGAQVAVVNQGRPGAASYALSNGTSATLTGGGGSGGDSGGGMEIHLMNGVYHTGEITHDQATWALARAGTYSISGNMSVDAGITIDGVDLSAHAHTGAAGHGVQIAHGSLTGLTTGDDHTQYALRARQISSGSGLTGGGDLSVDRTLAVGAGSGITVNADDVAVTWATAAITAVSLTAGSQGSGTKVAREDHGHALDVSIAPTWTGLHTFANTVTARTILPQATDTYALGSVTYRWNELLVKALTAATGTFSSDLTVGANVLFVDQSQSNIGINRAPDLQFDLDINGNLRAGGWIVGKHALQVKGAKMICHYDGLEPFPINFTGDPTGHMGQVGSISGGVIYRPGAFGKAVQLAEATTNLITNPSFEVNVTTGWNFYQAGSGGAVVKKGTHAYIGLASAELTSGNANAEIFSSSITVANGTSLSFQAMLWIPTGSVAKLQITLATSPYTVYIDSGNITANNDWANHQISWTNTTGGALDVICIIISLGTANTPIWIDAVQTEALAYTTPYADGSLGAGHAWTGTAHASTSTRAVAALSYVASTCLDLNAGSVSLWYYYDGKHKINYATLLRTYVDGDNFMYILSSSTADNPYCATSSAGILHQTGLVAEPVVGWNHIVMTWGANGLAFYLNGAQSGSTVSYAVLVGTPADIRIGYSGDSLIDDLVILDRALSATEVLAIYESNAPLFAETSTFTWRTGNTLAWADTEGLWAIDAAGLAAFGVSGVDGKTWGAKTLDRGDVLIGRSTNYILWDASAGVATFAGDGAGMTNINGGNIQTGTVTATQLNFTPVSSTNVVASINASAEGIRISASKIAIDGTVTFSAGYNPTEKETPTGAQTKANTAQSTAISTAAGDATTKANAAASASLDKATYLTPTTTTIAGGQITTGTITANQIAANTITASQLAATAIDAMTVTGATIRTAASGARTQLVSTGVSVYDASTERARAGNVTGMTGVTGTQYGLWTDNGYFTGVLNASALDFPSTVTSAGSTNSISWRGGITSQKISGWADASNHNKYLDLLSADDTRSLIRLMALRGTIAAADRWGMITCSNGDYTGGGSGGQVIISTVDVVGAVDYELDLALVCDIVAGRSGLFLTGTGTAKPDFSLTGGINVGTATGAAVGEIQASGNIATTAYIGAGMSTPDEPLAVSGLARFHQAGADRYIAQLWVDSISTKFISYDITGAIYLPMYIVGSTLTLRAGTAGNIDALTIDTSGNTKCSKKLLPQTATGSAGSFSFSTEGLTTSGSLAPSASFAPFSTATPTAFSGLLMVSDITNNSNALYLCRAGTSILVASDGVASWTTGDDAGSLNVFYTAGGSPYLCVKNHKASGNVEFRVQSWNMKG